MKASITVKGQSTVIANAHLNITYGTEGADLEIAIFEQTGESEWVESATITLKPEKI